MRREKLNYFVIQIIRKVYNPVISESYIPHDGIQPCYFENLYAATWLLCAALSGIQPCYFRVSYTRHRHIQFPKGAGVISDLTDQPTEYSCFTDDHASPQA